VKLSPASKWLFHETEVSRREKRKKKVKKQLVPTIALVALSSIPPYI